MKDIKNFFKSDVIFRTIIKEAKESLPIVDMSFEEWLKELPNDKDGAEVVSVSGLPTEDRFNNKVTVLASTSFISGYKELEKQLGDDKKYATGLVVIPFENFYLAIKCEYRSKGNLDQIGLYAVQPKTVSIKSVINVSKSAFKVYCTVYLSGNENEKEIIEHILKYANRQEIIDRNDNKWN